MVKKQNGGHLKTGPKFCPKNDRLNTRGSGFRMLTVVQFFDGHCISIFYLANLALLTILINL
jgi:hypothetical protein